MVLGEMISDLALCDICAAIYPRDDPDWGNDRIRVFKTIQSGCLVISPAGSRTLEDWAIDLQAFEERAARGLGSVTWPFFEDVLTVIDAIEAECRASSLPIVVDGHSKGGAEAQDIAAELTLRGIVVARLVTFEAPAVGALNGVLLSVPGIDFAHLGDDIVVAQPPGRPHPRPQTWFPDPALPEDGDLFANHHLATAIRPALVTYLAREGVAG
jgi:hypothetical protein